MRTAWGREDHMEEHDGDPLNNQQTGLLVALLLRYPEIGSVRLCPENRTITLSFLMAKRPDASEIEKFKDRVATAFSAFSRLEGDGLVRHVDIGTRPQGPITVLDVRRHLDGLVVEDFSILLGMVKSSFGESIITEDSQDEGKFFDEDDSTIAFGLDQFRSARQGDELIGLRHDGRVLLFTHA